MVTRDTPWLAGTPCWADVTVGDVPKAIAFYQALFGWDIESGAPETGGYSICHKNGRIVAGLSPNFGPPGALPTWTTYLAADDADAGAAAIKAAGGPPPTGPGSRPRPGGRAATCWSSRPMSPIPAGWPWLSIRPEPSSACGRAGRRPGSAWPTRPARRPWKSNRAGTRTRGRPLTAPA